MRSYKNREHCHCLSSPVTTQCFPFHTVPSLHKEASFFVYLIQVGHITFSMMSCPLAKIEEASPLSLRHDETNDVQAVRRFLQLLERNAEPTRRALNACLFLYAMCITLAFALLASYVVLGQNTNSQLLWSQSELSPSASVSSDSFPPSSVTSCQEKYMPALSVRCSEHS